MSVWSKTIQQILRSWDGAQITPQWEQVAKLMINYGARTDKKLVSVLLSGAHPSSGYGLKVIALFKHFREMKRDTTSGWFSWAPWTLSSTLPIDRTSRNEA